MSFADQVKMAVYYSPWRNCYWFARMLMNTDQYGAVGKKDTLLLSIVSHVETILAQATLNDEEKFAICKDIITNKISASSKSGTKAAVLANDLVLALDTEINCINDIIAFIITARYIVIPTNAALSRVPSNDVEFCYETAKQILDSLGKTGVGRLLAAWDTLGVKGCLNLERNEIVSEFTKLVANLNAISYNRTEIETNTILTAFVQEFERRAGQKRKSRAGNSLEDVTTFLFNYYGFSSHQKPDHFQTDIEVDKWFKCTDGWSIGISCKRTLRERWKQVSSADSNALSRYKIKEIWHLMTYDRDLSDDKLVMLGQQRQAFYLSDSSDKYMQASAHLGMKDYVRPLSRLIDDIAAEQGKNLDSFK